MVMVKLLLDQLDLTLKLHGYGKTFIRSVRSNMKAPWL